MPDPSLDTLRLAYQNLYPKEDIPSDISSDQLFRALLKSQGRKIVFTKAEKDYLIFFEDNGEEEIEINWNRLIGCGP